MEFARRVGARSILVLSGDGKTPSSAPAFKALENSVTCENLTEAAEHILKRGGPAPKTTR